MGNNLRDIRRKIKAIKSTRQVTKAMELVAAAKMRRAVQNAQLLRQYAIHAWTILQRIAATESVPHPFLVQKPTEKVLTVLFTSDRGLCGNLNAQMFRTTLQYLRSLRESTPNARLSFVAVGKKGAQFLQRQGQTVIAAFPALSNHPTFRDVLPLSRLLLDGFRDGTYDHIVLLYPDFVSPLIQEPLTKVLLPLSDKVLREMIAPFARPKRGNREEDALVTDVREYLFEPSPSSILETILPQLTEVQVYQAVLEAAASEHSARMIAMRNASDSASDLIDDLTLTYNQTRQSIITAEIAELSASKAALE